MATVAVGTTVALLLVLLSPSISSARKNQPAPARLMVENMPTGTGTGAGTGSSVTSSLVSPGSAAAGLVVVSTRTPRFSFVPHSEHDHPGQGVAMTAFQIRVGAAHGQVEGDAPEAHAPPGEEVHQGRDEWAWDSGRVNGTAAVSVVCGKPLAPMTSWRWEAVSYTHLTLPTKA